MVEQLVPRETLAVKVPLWLLEYRHLAARNNLDELCGLRLKITLGSSRYSNAGGTNANFEVLLMRSTASSNRR